MDEAMHPLTILAVGLYGKVLPNQNGAPIRLVVPWKYGFKSTKAITKISLVEKMPKTSWMKAGPSNMVFTQTLTLKLTIQDGHKQQKDKLVKGYSLPESKLKCLTAMKKK